jgi:hypothetical protein
MATYSLRSRRGLDGLRVRPVLRLRVTYPFPADEGGDIDVRYTLRSDGATLRSVKVERGWSSPNIWSPAPEGRTLDEVIALWPDRVSRYIRRRSPGATIIEEAL